jgi:hypothetical protein
MRGKSRGEERIREDKREERRGVERTSNDPLEIKLSPFEATMYKP